MFLQRLAIKKIRNILWSVNIFTIKVFVSNKAFVKNNEPVTLPFYTIDAFISTVEAFFFQDFQKFR